MKKNNRLHGNPCAIFDPKGNLVVGTKSLKRHECRAEFANGWGSSWQEMWKRGFRVRTINHSRFVE